MAAAEPDTRIMKLETSRFGSLDVDPTTIIHFPLGLLGFERFQRYILIDSDAAAPMRWLQCVDEGSLAFLVVEPHLFFPDYAPKLTADDRDVLQLDAGDEPLLACVVVVPEVVSQMTINLQGPLALNGDKRIGKQVILHDGPYTTRHRLIPDEAAANAEPVA
jgi:flagellar assembly factor FliW